jgi:hypothetical protein
MRVTIDGDDLTGDLPELSTFGDMVAEAASRAAARGRIVRTLEVDGREISTREEREMAGRPAGEIGELRVSTTTSGTLLREAIDGALDLSLAIRRDVKTMSSFLQSGDVPAATAVYVSCVESLGTFFQLAGAVFNGFQSGAFSLSAGRSAAEGEMPAPPTSTAEILQRLFEAQQAEDWRKMSDLLESEMVPNLGEWSAFFAAMRGREAK